MFFDNVALWLHLYLENSTPAWLALKLMPFFLFLELPFGILVITGIFGWTHVQMRLRPRQRRWYPPVSCAVLCYAEGKKVQGTIRSLCEQVYEGEIELLLVVDGAAQNPDTLNAVRAMRREVEGYKNRRMVILPRWQRGGRVSSINTALFKARGDVFLVLDGDTTFDNDMVWHITRHFEDPNVPAVSGNLRPANVSVNLTTRIQGIEYLLSILGARTGLGFFNMVNNVSGAFGAFRTATVRLLGGWDTHTAEDLDMTLRLKSYFGHYRNMRIPFEPRAIGHTCVPESFGEFLEQRKRWDGDLPFIYLRKHWRAFSPTLTGWSNFLLNVFYGLSIQLLLPLLLVVYLLYLLVALPWLLVLGIMLLVYVIYLSISLFMFLVVWGLMSERPRQDAALIPYLLIFPFYMFCMRWWSAAAILHEMFNRGHLDSSMAPYWVLKRGRKF